MKNHAFNTLQLADGSQMELYVAFPESTGNYPAVIVLQEGFGLTQHIRNVVERLYAEGYAAVSPELFHRTGHLVEAAYDDFPTVMHHIQAITKEGLATDLKAAYGFLQEQDNVIKDKVGSIGFCLGGRVSFLANAILPLAAGVSYYGGGIDQLTDEAPNLHGAHLFYWGGLDKHITPDKIDTAVEAVKKAGKDYTNVVISYADHGFNCDNRASYHPLAAREAWAHTLSFLKNRLT